ncbi:MAG: hypothetical protein RBU30_16410 [Polyangia bacterium]|jgi:hypothetical protein|nr:hypothetical protein [Polyangia bacterium]
MLRAIKILSVTLGVILLLLVGAAAALFFSENSEWVPLALPYPRASFGEPFGVHTFEIVIGVAAAGWLLALAFLGAALVLLPLYLRRARQMSSMVRKLEKELVALRNLPFEAPAPLEDLEDEPTRPPAHSEDFQGDLVEELAPQGGAQQP